MFMQLTILFIELKFIISNSVHRITSFQRSFRDLYFLVDIAVIDMKYCTDTVLLTNQLKQIYSMNL